MHFPAEPVVLLLVHGRRLRGPLFGLGHARLWLLLIVLVLIIVAAWVSNRNRR